MGEIREAEPLEGRMSCVEDEVEIQNEELYEENKGEEKGRTCKSVELQLRPPSQQTSHPLNEPVEIKDSPTLSLEPELLLNPELNAPIENMSLTEYSGESTAPLMLQFINKPEQDDGEVSNQNESLIISNGLGLETCSPELFILTEDQGNQLIQAFEYDISEDTGTRCESCLSGFSDSKELLNHLKSCKSVLSFKCPTCRREFATEARLEKHDKLHVSEKKFVCQLCEKTFSTGKILKRHFRVHTGEKPYECEFCHKKFGSGSNLSEHRTLHTGRMAYSCELCGGKYRLWSTFNKHRMKCEGKVEEQSEEELVPQETVSHYIMMNEKRPIGAKKY